MTTPAQQVLEALKEIARADPECESMSGDVSCMFCHAFRPYEDHGKECAWVKSREAIPAAKKLVEIEQGEQLVDCDIAFDAQDDGWNECGCEATALEGFRRGWKAAVATNRESVWQPIETAPEDGTWILVKQVGVLEPSVTVCAFDPEWGENGWWMCCDGKNPEIPLRGPAPKLWMPLPASPKAMAA